MGVRDNRHSPLNGAADCPVDHVGNEGETKRDIPGIPESDESTPRDSVDRIG